MNTIKNYLNIIFYLKKILVVRYSKLSRQIKNIKIKFKKISRGIQKDHLGFRIPHQQYEDKVILNLCLSC